MTCRICLSHTIQKDIIQLEEEIKEDNKYTDIMWFCLNIEVTLPSNISTKLCLKCFKKVIAFYKFKKLAMKNDTYLRQQSEPEIKNEMILVNEDDMKYEMTSYDDNVDTEDNIDIKEENNSDDEFLIVLKKIKEENMCEESKENVKVKTRRKRNREFERRGKVCDECGKTVNNLKEHMRQHGPNKRTIKCKMCDKLFSSYSARYRHHKTKHLGIKSHCDKCNKDVISLKQHNLVVHNPKDLKYGCVPCGRRFITQSALEAHASVHTDDRPHKCDECPKSFRQKLSLSMHKRQVHEQEKSHLCQFCSKRFFKKYHLQVHLRSHLKERPYECNECGKFYSSTSTLKSHKLTHAAVKSFFCQLCDMAFLKPSYLHNHMISHTKEKKHACQYCGVLFGRSDHRKRHERTAHEANLLAAQALRS